MLADEIDAPGEMTAEELLGRYEEHIADAIAAAGESEVREATGLAGETVAAAASGDAAGLQVADVAAILALAEDEDDAETMLAEVRNRLLLEMSSAMLDVDRVAAEVEGDLDPKEIQAMVEGRHPMTLEEYARLHHYIATEADW